MKIVDHLDKEQKRKLNQLKQNKEKINWHDIMGMNRDTYRRGKGGAIRRK